MNPWRHREDTDRSAPPPSSIRSSPARAEAGRAIMGEALAYGRVYGLLVGAPVVGLRPILGGRRLRESHPLRWWS